MLRSLAASSVKGYLPCPSAGLATVFRGAVDCSKLARAMRLPEQQQRAAQFRATRMVSLVDFQSYKPLGSLAVLNGCFNIKGFGFRIVRSKLDLNMAAITYDRTLGCRITEFESSPIWMERDGLPRKDGRAG